MRVLMLYRPRLPGQRAQALQTVHMADALARAGHTVTVLADRGDAPVTPAAALARFGLAAHPRLDLRVAPIRQRGLAGLWFRRELARWWALEPGLVYARDLRRLVEAVRRHGPRHRVVLEVHGQGASAGQDGVSDAVLELECAAAECADVVVANCEGTAEAWRGAHGVAARVSHNGTAAQRVRAAAESDGVVRVVGSLRSYKGWSTLLSAAAGPGLGGPLELVGGHSSELSARLPAAVRVRPPVAHHAVPDLLARSAVLLLPLADNRFGRTLTSPLKLWDYLATATPLVLPELPAIRRALACVGTTADAHFYRPGAVHSLRAAVQAALCAPRRAPVLRSWDDRVAELRGIFNGSCPSAPSPSAP